MVHLRNSRHITAAPHYQLTVESSVETNRFILRRRQYTIYKRDYLTFVLAPGKPFHGIPWRLRRLSHGLTIMNAVISINVLVPTFLAVVNTVSVVSGILGGCTVSNASPTDISD